ncbi:hypothetical protein Xsze_04032 [Xenorhabdus szentirmaii DSM 16338]|nr:hypothetical protein Xsze_04032 [Xenorhabdus szentirmaii DSM 16338]
MPINMPSSNLAARKDGCYHLNIFDGNNHI